MLIYKGTTDVIELVTGSAIDLDVVVSWTELIKSTGAWADADTTVTAITTATTTSIAAAPASDRVRRIRTIHARNRDTVDSSDVTIQLDRSGTNYELFKVTLAPGDSLEYIDGVGFFVLTNVALLFQTKRVTADVINATTSFADVTGLTVAIQANKNYVFEAWLIFQTNATTTGARFGINGPASPTNLRIGGAYGATHGISGVIGMGAATAYDTAVPAHTTGPSTTPGLGFIGGTIENGANAGNLVVRFQSEVAVASGLTVLRGSWFRVQEIP